MVSYPDIHIHLDEKSEQYIGKMVWHNGAVFATVSEFEKDIVILKARYILSRCFPIDKAEINIIEKED